MEQILISRHSAAKALDISLRKIDYLIAQGAIPARKLGRRTLIPRAALEKFALTPRSVNGDVANAKL